MPLLEVFVYYNNDVIYDKPFFDEYSQKVLDDNTRNDLLESIVVFAQNAFEDEIQSFSTDVHQIHLHRLELKFPGESFAGMDRNIYISAIADLSSNKKAITKVITEILYKFVNRYTLHDITNKKKEAFYDFDDRMDEMCKHLIDASRLDKGKGEKLTKEFKRAQMAQQGVKSNSYNFHY